MEHQIKGNKVILTQGALKEYLERKIAELSAVAANIVMALIMVSLLVILNSIKVPYYYLFAVILIPILGRGFCQSWIDGWLQRFFRELLEIA
jgi:hypothetical protein